MIDSGRGGGVNYQMQIVTKLPNGTTEVAQNDLEQPILQLFQSFPTEVAQNDSEWPISQLFQSFPTEVAQNDSGQPIQAKLLILSHFSGKRLEKLQIRQNWPFRVILSHFGGKRLEKW